MPVTRSRPLTTGEIAMASSVFGPSIDYARVRLHLGKFWWFHPRGVAMAPMGDIYFHPNGGGWSEDFSLEPIGLQGFFMHELTHVWQAQHKGRWFLPLMRHPFCRYDYRIRDGQRFDRYGLEQQAELVRHAFLAAHNPALAAAPPKGLLPFV